MKKTVKRRLSVLLAFVLCLSACSAEKVPQQSSAEGSASHAETQTAAAPSETVPSETAPPETEPSETALPETLPPETAPPETAPPETIPPETAPPETEPADNPNCRLGGQPVKTLYVAGEIFDPTGLYVYDCEDASVPFIAKGLKYSQEPLQAGMTEIALSYAGCEFSCPIEVLPGDGIPAFVSRVPEEQEQQALADFFARSGAQSLPNRDSEPFAVQQPLPNPCPDGHVHNLDELAEYVDYHVFYGIGSVTVWLDYEYSDPEQELNRLYWRSELLGGMAALQLHDPGSGPMQILLRYYRDQLFYIPRAQSADQYLSPFRKTSSRSSFSSPRIREDGISVFTTDQAIYALIKGYDIAPAEGSPAKAAIRRAYEILTVYGDENWSDMDRLYHILLYFLDNAGYDDASSSIAGDVPDPELEPDFYSSRLVSFRPDGPLMYGATACYGSSKAAALLLALEGYQVARVVSSENTISGRRITQDKQIRTHSYLYVRINGEDLLYDVTYSYAGTGTAHCFRDPCLCLSYNEHRELYRGFQRDWYSARNDYRPSSRDRMNEIRLDDGTTGMLLKSKAEWDAFMGVLGQQILAQQGESASATVIVTKQVFGDRRKARQAALDFCDDYSSHYSVSLEGSSFSGKEYYTLMITLKKDK